MGIETHSQKTCKERETLEHPAHNMMSLSNPSSEALGNPVEEEAANVRAREGGGHQGKQGSLNQQDWWISSLC